MVASAIVLAVAAEVGLLVTQGFSFRFSGQDASPNAVAAVLWCFVVLQLYARYRTPDRRARTLLTISTVVTAALIVLTRSRGVLLAMLFWVSTYLIWPWLARCRARFGLFLPGVCLTLAGLTYAYVWAFSSAQGMFANLVLNRFSGQNLLSGRQTVWPAILGAIAAHPWVGYGAGAQASDFSGQQLSAHNLYLQLALQVGLIGVALFVFGAWGLWRSFWPGRRDWPVRLCGSFLAGVLAHEAFEVSFTQNNVAIGMLLWLILAVGAGLAARYRVSGRSSDDQHTTDRAGGAGRGDPREPVSGGC
jgi:O-antigen ligase